MGKARLIKELQELFQKHYGFQLTKPENLTEHDLATMVREMSKVSVKPTMNERERAMMELAKRLHFRVEKQGSKYSLRRVADVSAPVEKEGLALEEAEEFLNTWKLRGFHGG